MQKHVRIESKKKGLNFKSTFESTSALSSSGAATMKASFDEHLHSEMVCLFRFKYFRIGLLCSDCFECVYAGRFT